ncbi:MAG: leucyl/phenylalanyl-tRNA--protein transferase [Methylococcales bacterium]|jgi:leucyl/phenylalanyl-tRNA---protein transferase|nr:leucyl/phenylalanyl-tRNA--protein transferase [Methylococcales bacterium]MBT7442626.1 leucyl/phenylalanyl-tRNA--protein transferase [Methylococcales bacterium]
MVALLHPNDDETPFPPLDEALEEPDGLLALGGRLSSKRLLDAYRQGIFPWYNSDDDPVMWWSPDPRLVLFPEGLKISKSLRKTIKKAPYEVSFDQAFEAVLDGCAEPRDYEEGTWITSNMRSAYIDLHQQGYAHSVECWDDGELVGGLHGITLDHIFFGESMFHRKTDASKIAFVHLVQFLKAKQYAMIDCQVKTEHLMSLGATEIPRQQFSGLLNNYINTVAPQHW